MLKPILFLFFFTCASLIGKAQELPPIQYYSPSVYEAGNQNWMVAESEDHKIYIANNKGLLVFNGAQWNLYKTPNESIMRSVKVDGNRVYTGCYMDFGYWESNETGKLEYTSILSETGFTVDEDEQFWNISVRPDYVLFQSLSHIYLYDKKENTVSPIVEDLSIQKFFTVDSSYYYQVLGEGLYQILNGNSQLLSSDAAIRDKAVVHMFELSGITYIMTEDAVLFKLQKNELIKHSTLDFENPVTIYSVDLLSDNSLLLGTISSGMISSNIDGTVNYSINQNSGLGNNTCLSVFQDSNNNVWIGLDNGLSCVNQDSPYLVYKDRNGKLGTIYAAARYDNRIFIGTNQGLFSKADDENSFSYIEGSAGQVWSLEIIDDTLFCSHNLGLFTFNDNRLKLLHNTGTWQVQQFSNNSNLALVGSYKGLYSIEKNNNGDWSYKSNVSGFNISSKDITIENNQVVYVNHEYKGVYRLELNNDLSTVVSKTLVPELKKGIGSDIALYDGKLFYAKRDSVFVKKTDSDTFKLDPVLSDLFKTSDYTSGSLEVAGGYLWTFNKGYIHQIEFEDINGNYKIDKIKLPKIARKEKVGYENLTMIAPETYLIGSSFGYSYFNTAKIALQEDFDLSITSVTQQIENNTIQLAIDDEATIDFEGNNILISYAVNNYEAMRVVEYRHRLIKDNEVADKWSQWSTDTQTSYEGLRFGDYKFEVQYKKINESLSEPISYSFTIGRPYYLTNTAIVVYVILALLLIALLNGFYLWYFKKQKTIALQKQQKELELQNLTNEKNIIELRNAKLRSDIEHRNRELAVSTMAMIKKNETLNELKSELQKLPKDKATSSLKKMLDKNLNSKQDWITFEEAFNNADKDFFKKIKEKHPSLSSGDLRLCVYLRLNLSSKEIAPLLNISPRSVEIKRYRLRKKLGLTRNDSLTSYIVEI